MRMAQHGDVPTASMAMYNTIPGIDHSYKVYENTLLEVVQRL